MKSLLKVSIVIISLALLTSVCYALNQSVTESVYEQITVSEEVYLTHGTVLSVSVPVSLDVVIDSAGTTHISEFTLSNNSGTPIEIGVALSQDTKHSTVKFENVLPEEKDWDNLNLLESRQYMAFGTEIIDVSQWLYVVNKEVYLDDSSSGENKVLGGLAGYRDADLRLVMRSGKVFDEEVLFKYNIQFIFDVLE